MSIQRTTSDGVKLWIAPKIQGIGDGIKEGQIVVVRRDDYERKIAELKAQNDQICELNLKLHAENARLRAPVSAYDVGGYFIYGGRQYRFNKVDQQELASFMANFIAARAKEPAQ